MCDIYRDPIHIIDRDADSFEGIISENELVSAQERICDVIRYPTTVIDNYKCIDHNGYQYKRIDSKRSSIIFCKACDAYRLITDSRACHQCDETHADILFHCEHEIINGQKDKVQEYIDSEYMKTISTEKMHTSGNEKPIYTEKWVGKSNMRYLRYSCPMTGLTELIFPIIIENHVVGVLFVGQLILLQNKVEIRQARRQLVAANRDKIKKHIKEVQQKAQEQARNEKNILLRFKNSITKPRCRSIIHNLKKIHDREDNYLSFDPKKYKEKQKKKRQFQDIKELEEYITLIIHPQIEDFEAFLQRELHSKFDRYISVSIHKQIKILKEHSDQLISEKRDIRGNTAEILMRDFWAEVRSILKDIQDKFKLSNIEIYLYNPNSTKLRFKLECSLLAADDAAPVELDNDEWDTLSHSETSNITDFGLLQKFKIRQPETVSMQYESILNQRYISILTYPRKVYRNKELKDSFRNHISRLITTIMHELAIIKNTADSLLTMRILRLYRHEISHLSLGLSGVNRNLEKPEQLKSLHPDKINAIHRDFSSCLQLLNFMTKEIGIFTGSIKKRDIEMMEIKDLKIFKQMIWKWEILYQDELAKRGLSIITGREDLESIKSIAGRPHIKSNPQMLELIIYNIVNNAIKYAHDGSRIYIDCDVTSDYSTRQKFTVIDYGQQMTNDPDLPYELYYRDPALNNLFIAGNGIGLYVSKQAADYIGAKISHKVTKVSDYYVPFIEPYLSLINGPFPVEKEVIENDWKQRKHLYTEVINQQSNQDYPRQKVLEKILTPTYKVIFEVIL